MGLQEDGLALVPTTAPLVMKLAVTVAMDVSFGDIGHWSWRLSLPVGKAILVGAKDRATNQVSAAVVPGNDMASLQGFVASRAAEGAKVYTDEHKSYQGMRFDHETVNHSVSEYVRDKAHTNGIESFWTTLKRAYHGTFHHLSPKHLQRYVSEFAAKHNIRDRDTIDQMNAVVAGMVGKRLMYRELIAD